MGRKCCVTNCNDNYDSQAKEKTFRLPRDMDEREQWLKIIPRHSTPDTKKHSGVRKALASRLRDCEALW